MNNSVSHWQIITKAVVTCSGGYLVRRMKQLPQPPFLSCREAPLLKMACVLLGYFVAFRNGSLVVTTVEVQTKSGYFAFDCILPLQAILPFNVCVSSKLAYLLQCS